MHDNRNGEFEPHQYIDIEQLDARAESIDLNDHIPQGVQKDLLKECGRFCLHETFLRRETLVYSELPPDHPARKLSIRLFIEERMLDQVDGIYPRHHDSVWGSID